MERKREFLDFAADCCYNKLIRKAGEIAEGSVFMAGRKMQEETVTRVNTTSVVQQTIDYLTGAIMRREYTPGSRIPTELELAELLGVSRNTVREAVKILVFMGVLEIRRPEGTFVCSGFSNSLIDPMLYGIILNQGDSYDSLMELREMMEVGVMHIVITKATDEEIASLREPLAALKAACLAKKPDLEKVVQMDDAFHQAINELGGNQMVNKISNMVRTLTHAMRRESVDHMLRTGRADELYRAHERIFTTLRNRDSENLNHMVRSTYFVNGQALD